MAQNNYDQMNNQTVVSNMPNKFRDEFNAVNNDYWEIKSDVDFDLLSGDSIGSSYYKISKNPFIAGAESTMVSKRSFNLPLRAGFGVTLSQRYVGQEHVISLVSIGDNGNEEESADPTPIAISGNITVSTNVWTINTVTPHGLKPSDRFVIYGCDDTRLNVGPLQVTSVVSTTQITITSTLANATYTVGAVGFIKKSNPCGRSMTSAGFLFDNNNVSNAVSFAKIGNSSSVQTAQINYRTTTALPATPAAFSDQFTCPSTYEMWCGYDEIFYRSFNSDSNAGLTATKKTQSLLDIEKQYRIKIRSKNLENMSRPIAKIVTATKTGTTTATIVTDVAHGLSTNSFVQILGVRDQTNFANTTAATQVASIVSPTSFTIVFGAAVTIASGGGMVFINHGGVLSPSPNLAIQSIQRTSNLLTVTLNTTASGFLVGETYSIYGLQDSVAADIYDGIYKIANITGSTVILESVGADFGLINTGGSLVKRTDFRIHYVRAADHTRHAVEVYGGLGRADDLNNSVQVNGVINTGTLATVASVSSSNTAIPLIAADVTSAALTTTTTSSTITPLSGSCYKVQVPVTAVTGTSPTLDFSIDESADGGTNWFRVYDFPRITATGSYTSPTLVLTGNRIRYVQTVGGTTPSFTRAVNRMQSSSSIGSLIRQLIDRTISLTTLNSTTAVIDMCELGNNIQLVVSVGAITTTAPVIQLEGSDDGAKYYSIGAPLLAVASTAVQAVNLNINCKFARARVSTAGVGVTADYILIKGF